jgi:hypothetical protein
MDNQAIETAKMLIELQETKINSLKEKIQYLKDQMIIAQQEKQLLTIELKRYNQHSETEKLFATE